MGSCETNRTYMIHIPYNLVRIFILITNIIPVGNKAVQLIIKWIDDCEELIKNKIKDKNCPECANDPDAIDYLKPPHFRNMRLKSK